jgi:hypothetical protein
VNQTGAQGRLISTGLAGEAFDVGHGRDGRLFVAAGQGATLEYVAETGGPDPRWTAPRRVVFQANGAELLIEKIMTHHHAGNLFVGAVLKVVEPDGAEHCSCGTASGPAPPWCWPTPRSTGPAATPSGCSGSRTRGSAVLRNRLELNALVIVIDFDDRSDVVTQ